MDTHRYRAFSPKQGKNTTFLGVLWISPPFLTPVPLDEVFRPDVLELEPCHSSAGPQDAAHSSEVVALDVPRADASGLLRLPAQGFEVDRPLLGGIGEHRQKLAIAPGGKEGVGHATVYRENLCEKGLSSEALVDETREFHRLLDV